jgi:2-haloacid dehalogenase
VAPERICFLSANGWDVSGAAHFGFRVVWINRSGAPPERLPGQAEHEIRSLHELPVLLDP